MRRSTLLSLLRLVLCLGLVTVWTAVEVRAATVPEGGPPSLANPVMFVTQVPIPADFATIGSTFANHSARIDRVGRGGDLYVRYPNGTLRNLTQEAGYGASGIFQGAAAIAVRDPAVHWSGTKALFSMVIGAPTEQYEVTEEYWQIYEVTGFGQGQTVSIVRVPHQPDDTNNVTPFYAPDGRVLFTSDRPRDGARHLYPQHDEYESTATNTGIWSLDPATGELDLLNHTPSGAFTPLLDSYGRVIFTRWDHLQRDQQANVGGNVYGTFNYSDESADAALIDSSAEVFPEPLPGSDELDGTNLEGNRINHFFPWQMLPDGREEETLNHVGRHELHDYFNRVFNDDPELDEFIASVSGRTNPNSIENFFQIAEDGAEDGVYFGVEAPEFYSHASGQIVSLEAPPTLPADQIVVTYVTHPATATIVPDGETPPAAHSGHYRDPLPTSDGVLIAAHTAETHAADNDGTRANPIPRYLFRLRAVDQPSFGHLAAGAALTPGIVKHVRYWDPDVMVSYDGPLWEMSPVEVRSRPAPPVLTASLPALEAQVLAEEEVTLAEIEGYLAQRELALVVSRDVTTRDTADRQQPFNLRVPGGGVQTTGSGGEIYPVRYMQFFQGDQIRGIGGIDDPRPGRRVLAQVMHDPAVNNPPAPAGPPGSVKIAADGSMAALVPAHRAMSWQMTDGAGTPVVRERYWLTFQPGEVRVCTSCHGLNSEDQAGQPTPVNPPEALRELLRHFKTVLAGIFADGFESGDTSAWSSGG